MYSPKSALFVIASSLILVTQVAGTCPDGAVEWQNACLFFQPNATSFPNAEIICNGMSGHLASVHDGFTNAILSGQAANYFKNNNQTDFWVGATTLIVSGNWSWTDSSGFDFKDWDKPNNASGASCVSVKVNSGIWASSDCFTNKPFVCYVNSSMFDVTTTVIPVFTNCTHGWTYFEPTHSCFGINSAQSSSWSAAEQHCLDQGGHLPSIHSPEEEGFLQTFVITFNNRIWIGLYSDDAERTFKWSDNTTVDYTHWEGNNPNMGANSCASLDTNGFVDDQCYTSMYYLCKKDALGHLFF